MTSLQFVVHPTPSPQEQLNERFKEVSDKINKYGPQTSSVFAQLKTPVKQIVIGPGHLGLLLEDGRAYRVAFSVIPDRLDLNKQEPVKSNGSGGGGSGGQPPTSGGSKNAPGTSRQLARSRARIMRTSSTVRIGGSSQNSGSRSTGVIIGGSSSGRSIVAVPAPFVPEELVSQAQVVLQGKSRNIIIRELQRTNLDVNLAVNNLLSRDDEEGEDTEDGGENYVPEDLISLLDNGFQDNSVIIDADAMFSEDMFGYSSMRSRSRSERNPSVSGIAGTDPPPGRSSGVNGTGPAAGSSSSSSTANTSSQVPPSGSSGSSALPGTPSGSAAPAPSASSGNERDPFSRWRDRQYFGPRRWFQNTREESTWERDPESKKKEMSSGLPIWISDELEAWPEKDGPIRFSQIAGLHSEFIGISLKGELHQWRWSDTEAYRNVENGTLFHPKTQALHLIFEKITHISATSIRCTVATETGRIATWMDDMLGHAGNKLEHSAIKFPDFETDKITHIHTCTLYSVARTENNNLYWWGVLPYGQRKKLWDKYKTKANKPTRPNTNSTELSIGTQVCMKKSPMYQPGAIGFTISNGVPKVGQLLNAAWDLTETCRFKLVTVPSLSNSTTTHDPLTSSELKDFSKSHQISASNSSSKQSTSNNSNKETADRLDMPPPPSPASSTCSDTGSVTSHKRHKRVTFKDENDTKKDEEVWLLRDVVFVEDVRSVPIGKVLKVDGAYAAVKFPNVVVATKDPAAVVKEEDAWQDCRLMRIDDLQIIKSTGTSRVPDCFQKIPRRVVLAPQQSSAETPSQLLTLTIDAKGIHAIMKTATKIHYSLFNLNTGRQEQDCIFPTDINAFLGSSSQNISLTCTGENNDSVLILRDGNNTIYPMAKDCVEAIRDPNWLDLPPIKCIAAAPLTLPSVSSNMKSQVAIVALITEPQVLMSRILRCDIEGIKSILAQLENELKPQLNSIISERCDGNRNIFHACISMCSPASNKDPDNHDSSTQNNSTTPASNSGLECINVITNAFTGNHRPVSIREMMRRATQTANRENLEESTSSSNVVPPVSDSASLPVVYWPPEYYPASGDEDSLTGLNPSSNKTVNNTYISDATERRTNSVLTLSLMCDCPALQPFLRQLLSSKDAQGQTPFMLAVSSRAYQAGIVIFNTILKIANGDSVILDSMIFPIGSTPDQSPLHVICCNDTCSFTWTGADHINQDIFECRTCGLTGSLCCCTECAKTCHKGHECRLKKTSPTAYCDCWEKCKCKALIAGNQTKRFDLLCRIAIETDLVTRFNSRGESILLFLIQTVGRQLVEQRQYRAPSRVRNQSGNSRKTPSLEAETDMPEHDLEPPRFARRALDRLLFDWPAVRSMIMTGAEIEASTTGGSPAQVFYEDSDNQSLYLQSQSGTTLLDKFTHSLFVRCSQEPLDTLLMTLVKQMQNDRVPGRIEEAQKVARRFVRSVARVFVIFSIEKIPNLDKQKSTSSHSRHIQTCKRVFQSLLKIAIEELCETADALIAPVRLGVVRPTAPFTLSTSSIDNSDDLFSVEPLAPANQARSNDILDISGPSSSRIIDNQTAAGFISRINVRLRDLDDNTDNDAIGQDDGEISEQDDVPMPFVRIPVRRARQMSYHPPIESNVLDEQLQDPLRNEENAQEAESDNEFFHEAETESDSDDNQSADVQRSSVTTGGATAGSDDNSGIGLLMLPEDDSGDSSHPDDDGSDEGETDDHSQEDYTLGDEQLERRTNSTSNHRSNLAPQSMQWAIRSRDVTRSSGVRLPGNSGLVFIDPTALRRTTAASAAVAAASHEPHTMASTASCLARSFGIVMRQISELLSMVPDYLSNTTPMLQMLSITYTEAVQLQIYMEGRLKTTWDWVLNVMDATEAQLRFGASLTNSADPAHPLHPLHSPHHQSTSTGSNSLSIGVPGPDATTARREFLSYCLSLMRSHNSEHRDSLPVLDVTALKHIAYVLDAIIYYMRSGSEIDTDRTDANYWNEQDENENEDNDDEFSPALPMEQDSIDDTDVLTTTSLGRRHSFFTRSESTLCLGCPPPDPFNTPMPEALPLADQPHLLQPNARREDLFGMPKQPITVPSTGTDKPGCNSPLELPPTRLGLSPNLRQNLISGTTNITTTPSPLVSTSKILNNFYEFDSPDDSPTITPTTFIVKADIHNPPALISNTDKMNIDEQQIDLDEIKTDDTAVGDSMISPNETDEILPEQNSQPAGPSDDSEPQYSNIYVHLKKRNYYDQYSDENKSNEQIEEPQDLSCSKENTQSSKMDVDSDNDDLSDSDADNDENNKRVSNKNECNLTDDTTQDNSTRPQIIVTPRKIAAAIQSVTANVLAKHKKSSLAECGANETPISLLPTNFSVFDLKSKQDSSTLGAGTSSDNKQGSTSGTSPSKSVIVRAGSSSCSNPDGIQSADQMETQEISANVTIETTPNIQQELPLRGIYFRPNTSPPHSITSDLLLGRWRLSLDLFGRVFMEDVGMEPGSIVSELGGFPVKEARFRRHMEKLRNAQQKDLTLSKMERNRTSLLVQTFKELNTQFGNQNRRIHPPLAFNRVKVTFKDEPGEGSGVARSFYTSVAEALLANEKLPSLETAQVGASKYSSSFSNMLRHRGGSGRESSSSRKGSNSKTLWRPNRDNKKLNYDARPFRPASQEGGNSNDNWTYVQTLGDRLYPKVYALHRHNAPKITGMLMELPPTQILMLLASDDTLRQKTNEAMEIIVEREKNEAGNSSINSQDQASGSTSSAYSSGNTSKKMNPIVLLEEYQLEDNAPLFYSPGKRGFYSPRQGYATYERINAFRNIGRLIGLCLLQNELFPLFLQRHVLKYILGRTIRFHDLAFFDPVVYESLRQLIKDSQSKNAASILATLELNFVIDLCPEEGSGTIELVTGGRDLQVNETNVYDYVRKYAEFRMIKTQIKALEALRLGVVDVLPDGALDNLTAEDLRLLLNGVGDIHVQTLISYTTFNDESGETNEKLLKFKRWLWGIVEKMSNLERQDLVYFWTGSPALPASEDGFQPMPSVTIRPADDAHLPTANTCISRLYIPLYSSKAVLRHKLLLAIKTKNFGFV